MSVPCDFPQFADLASRLLDRSVLRVAGRPCRLLEIELYTFAQPAHADPFAHRDVLQLADRRWYFHKSGGTYRGGSFKGLDLTLGNGTDHCGVLIRSLADAQGAVISGPSLCVDYLLSQTGAANVAALDAQIAGRTAGDDSSPLSLEEAAGHSRTIYYSSRVGLTLKKAHLAPNMVDYLLRPYRALVEPRSIPKGKQHLALALYLAGADADEIVRVTGCPRGALARYLEAVEDGRNESDPQRHFGKDLDPPLLSRLHGLFATAGLPLPLAQAKA